VSTGGWPAASVTRRVALPDGTRLHTVGFPTGDAHRAPFLLVHGLASNAQLWAPVAARLAAVGHPVAAVDLRAHGRSDPTDTLGTGVVADDLVAVARAWGFDRPIAVGQSWGGNVVLELGVRHPGAVRAVVGIDGGTIELRLAFADWDACWTALAPPDWDRGVRFAEVAARITEHTRDWPAGAAEAQLGNLVVHPDGSAGAVLTRDRHRAILRDLWDHRPSRLAEHVRVPVLLVPVDTGEPAWTSRKLDAVDATLDRLGRGRAVWLRDRDHDVHLQAPDEVADLLLGAVADGFLDPPDRDPPDRDPPDRDPPDRDPPDTDAAGADAAWVPGGADRAGADGAAAGGGDR
jgi:pimeloyl-ACP methyl ester carboxylesterase